MYWLLGGAGMVSVAAEPAAAVPLIGVQESTCVAVCWVGVAGCDCCAKAAHVSNRTETRIFFMLSCSLKVLTVGSSYWIAWQFRQAEVLGINNGRLNYCDCAANWLRCRERIARNSYARNAVASDACTCGDVGTAELSDVICRSVRDICVHSN